MPLYNVGVRGGWGVGGGREEERLWGSWCASDFHLTLMMFIYFGENGKYTKCKRDRQVCVLLCMYVCILYNFSFLSPPAVVVVVIVVVCLGCLLFCSVLAARRH